MGRHATASRRAHRAAAIACLTLAAMLVLAGRPAAAEELTLFTMTFVGSEAGVRDMTLSAERARFTQDADVALLEEVTLDAAGEGDTSSLLMTCDRARLELSSSDFLAEGNVRGRTADGHRFRTEAANFYHATRIIEGDRPVDIVDPSGTRLRGQGFRYDVRSQLMKMRNATVTEMPEGDDL